MTIFRTINVIRLMPDSVETQRRSRRWQPAVHTRDLCQDNGCTLITIWGHLRSVSVHFRQWPTVEEISNRRDKTRRAVRYARLHIQSDVASEEAQHLVGYRLSFADGATLFGFFGKIEWWRARVQRRPSSAVRRCWPIDAICVLTLANSRSSITRLKKDQNEKK